MSNLWLFGNLSVQDTESPIGTELRHSPKLKLNLGASYHYKGLNTSVIARHVDSYSTGNDSDDYDGQTVVDLNLSYPLSTTMNAAFRVTNLLDEDYFQPDNGDDGLPQPGREVLLSLGGRF